MLLERRAVIDARDVDDWATLHLAVSRGRAQVAQLLLEHGAESVPLQKSMRAPNWAPPLPSC